MKTAFLVFIVSMTFVCAEKLRYSSEFVDVIDAARRDCALKENVDIQLLSLLDDIKDLPSRETLKCLSFCVIRKLNLVNSQSILSYDKTIQLFDDPDMIAEVSASYIKCDFKEKEMNTCDDGYDIHKCLLVNV
ncbi:PREDICTED: uncharacterized protein LOC108569410 isoform X2 [Nicrophorus vespilloides]|uniref:Uncharacterized protein LOC108569410 isoform X2 n=1 Tax=Nicrophorus vespilloides TaxID=110193 RepID=A0ABM1NHZ1_NICVS|nr:PREDICTED: uncharacterized protein LOC108569410 isoform X2 [Nicrophorus vespilloides]